MANEETTERISIQCGQGLSLPVSYPPLRYIGISPATTVLSGTAPKINLDAAIYHRGEGVRRETQEKGCEQVPKGKTHLYVVIFAEIGRFQVKVHEVELDPKSVGHRHIPRHV